MIALQDAWAAYCFDSAVALFGNWIEGKLSELTKDGKPIHKIEHLLGQKASNLVDELMSLGGMGVINVKKGKPK